MMKSSVSGYYSAGRAGFPAFRDDDRAYLKNLHYFCMFPPIAPGGVVKEEADLI